MSTQLRRYTAPVRPGDLAKLLAGETRAETEDATVPPVDLASVEGLMRGLIQRDEKVPTWDAQLVEPFHRALVGLPRNLALDMRFWHWMTTTPLSELVWLRWYGRVPPPDEMSTVLTPSLSERFLGGDSLHGVSRNALARLWWCGASLVTDDDEYALAQQVLQRQDLFQAIFERRLGLYPPAARACVRELFHASEDRWRRAIARLNHVITTISLETLTEDDITSLLRAAS